MTENAGDPLSDIFQALEAPCTRSPLSGAPCPACQKAEELLLDYYDRGGDPHDILPALRQRALAGIGPAGKTAADCIVAGENTGARWKP